MAHQFAIAPQVDIPRSTLNRSHGVKTTFDSGYLIPFFVDEALPGDTHTVRTSGFARMATPIYPIMDNIFMETFYFAVPLRLLWTNFKKMMGEQEDPGDSTDYTTPQITIEPTGGVPEGSLLDYIGAPTQIAGTYTMDAWWTRAYNLIWNDWFRDQNLQDSVVVDTDDGPDTMSDYVLLRRGKRHDYFTSCLPWPYKSDNEVLLPLGQDAPITGIGSTNQTWTAGPVNAYETDGTGATTYANYKWIDAAGVSNTSWFAEEDPNNAGFPNIRADLANATASTINALRLAFQLQKLYERDARGGSRYIEIIKSHFGVTSPDARLQRPEYLGGGSAMVNITPVPQTSESGTTAQGTLAATGTVSFDGHGFTKSFTEHCVIIGLVNVRADLTYQQGMPRMFTRNDRYDYYWPALANIGEQSVLNKEIYFQAAAADDDVFGYQERYAEYRYRNSTIHGAFRSNAATSLDPWVLTQEFLALPTLGATFIEDNPPISRVVAVPSEPEFIGDFYHSVTSARPMPVYGVPGLIDHF